MHRIFISYKRVDKDKVFKIKDQIESALGEKCWIDLDGIESDAQFKSVIIKAILNCEIFLFMYSKAHSKVENFEKDWTMRELSFAEKKGKRIVFINIDNTPLIDEFEFDFGTKQQVNGTSEPEIAKLVCDLSNWLNISRNVVNHRISKCERLKTRLSRYKTHIFLLLVIVYSVGSSFMQSNIYLIISFSLALLCIGAYVYYRTHNVEHLNAQYIRRICFAFVCFFLSFCISLYLKSYNGLNNNHLVLADSIDESTDRILTFVVKGIKFNMIKVEGGEFIMASTEDVDKDIEIDEVPHKVQLSTFYIGESEVTQSLWHAVMGNNPSSFAKGGEYPVENVSWDDCIQFINKLNMNAAKQLNGKRFAFLTEAQWEYAAIGGKDGMRYKYCGSDVLSEVAWYDENSENMTHPVKMKKPNNLGIYDMSGNVWEWCIDKYGIYSFSSIPNPVGSDSGFERVDRGGGWIDNYKNCRTSNRGSLMPSTRFPNVGLRLALK